MSLRKYIGFILFVITLGHVSLATALSWSEATHDVLTADVNDDGFMDYLLRAKRVRTPFAIPYSISVDVNLLPPGISDIILYGLPDGTYAVDYTPLPSSVGDSQWNPSGWGALSNAPIYADFDGDGQNDLMIAPSGGGASVIILGREVAGVPQILQPEPLVNDPGAENIVARGSLAVTAPNTQTLSGTQHVGRIPHSFAVTATGKPVATIPLNLPPLVGSAKPALSLTYNGTNGNGDLGVGWFLNGVSSISRCPTILAREGYINGVNFNQSDRYCLDGQPLVAISGSYGANGTEYRTEQETFARIVSYGTRGRGPEYFRVWHKTGEIETYGATAESRLERQADTSVHTWFISQLEDRESNYAQFGYSTFKTPGSYAGCSASSIGEHLLCQIRLNGNSGLGASPKDSIAFEYETRPDIFNRHAEGLVRTTAKRLKHARTYVGTSLVRRYTLTYEQGAESGASRVTRVEECLASDRCVRPTDFVWRDGPASVTYSRANGGSENIGGPYSNPQYHLADVNADGRSDLIFTYRTNNTLGRVLYLANADGQNFTRVSHDTDTGYFASAVADADQQYVTGDFNGDGRSDLLWIGRRDSTVYRTLYIARSNGNGFDSHGYQIDANGDYAYFVDGRYIPADVNGDGRTDLVWVYFYDNTLAMSVYHAFQSGTRTALARVSSTRDTTFTPTNYQSHNFATGDVNGDGKADIVWTFWHSNVLARAVFLSNANGSGFDKLSLEREEGLFTYASIKDLASHLGDVNGDNRADLVITYREGANLVKRLYLATAGGTDFNLAGNAHISSPSGVNDALFMSSQVHLTDVNSDGRADLLYTYTYASTFGWVSYLANLQGNGFVNGQSGTLPEASTTVRHQQYLLGDVTADAKPDMVWARVESTNALARTTLTLPQSYPDHISRITDGFGNQTNIQYQYLADRSAQNIYVRGNAATYPARDDNGINYVVSRMDQSDGIGGVRAYTYRYESAQTDLRGRGFLGFAKRISTDLTTGLVTTEAYHQNYPYIGQLQSVVVADGALPFEKTFHHWKAYAYGTSPNVRYFVYQSDSASIKYNPGTSTPLFAALSLNTFDSTYGNLTREIKRVGSGFTGPMDATYDPAGSYTAAQISGWEKQQTTSYLHDINTANWRIGFVTSQTLTVEKPGEVTRSVENTFTPRSAASFLKANETLFAGTSYAKTINYASRDGWGNATRIEVAGSDYDGSSLPLRVTTYGTFADGLYPEWERNSLTHQTRYSYNSRIGTVAQETDSNGQITDIRHDDFGRKVYEKLADGTDVISTYSYTFNNCPARTVYAVQTRTLRGSLQGAPDRFECYDAFDRVVQSRTQDFAGNLVYTDTIYDNLGRVYRTSIPRYSADAARYTTFTYDLINRVTREDKPNGGFVTSVYAVDGSGNLTQTVTDNILDTVNGNRTTRSVKQYNTLNQVVRTLDHDNTPTDYAYDAWDNLRWVRVNNDAATDIVADFNDAGFKIRLDDPDAGVIQYDYDAFGNVRREIQNPGANQEIVVSEYDVLDRLESRTDIVAGISTLSGQWQYDTSANGVGLVALMSGPDMSEEYFYDARSRLKEKRTTLFGGVPRSFHYRYDSFSRPSVVAYPGGLIIENAYNATGFLNRVTNAADNNLVLWNATSGDKWGNISQYTLGNGLVSQRIHHADTGLIQTARTGTTATNGSVQNNSYTFDTANNLVRRIYTAGTSQTESFTYDGLNRVRTATTSGLSSGTRTLQYAYDALGNITFKTSVADVGGYRYDRTANAGPHAVTRTVLGATTRNYGYDAKGNMTANGSKVLRYTVFNNPYSITDAAANTSVDFRYGPDRRRFYQRQIQAGAVTETLYYDGGNYEIVKQGNTLRQKAYVGDYLVYQNLLAGTDINQPATVVDRKYTYLHRDNLGSTDAVTDQTGAVVTRNLFDPFGLRRDVNGQNATPAYLTSLPARNYDTTSRGYTGHEQLDSVGLIHMNGRVYDPTLGRFLSPDQYVQYPHFSQSYNRYSYVLNNPLSYNDPGGEIIPVLVWGAVAAWRAYSAYDTVTTAIDNYQTVVDPNASVLAKGMAVLDTGSSIVVPKAVREIAKKAVGPGVEAVASKISDVADKAADKIKSPAGPLPTKNQADSGTLSKNGNMDNVGGGADGRVGYKSETRPTAESGDRVADVAANGGGGAKNADTVLYQKVDKDGGHLKFGIAKIPEKTRYTEKQLNGGKLKILARGEKKDMLKLERDLHETLPIGPEEGQKFYIKKQVEKGLKPPPYGD